MKPSTKHVIDWLALSVLGLPIAILLFDYINNVPPSDIRVVLLMLDIPFGVAALFWLGGRVFSIAEERTKVVIDLISVSLCFIEVVVPWFFAYSDQRVGKLEICVFIVLINFVPFMFSFFYLVVRCARAATRVFGEQVILEGAEYFKFIVLVVVIFGFILMSALRIDPRWLQIGLGCSFVVILNLAYGAIRLIELRQRARGQLKP
jgi:hypothetical protein